MWKAQREREIAGILSEVFSSAFERVGLTHVPLSGKQRQLIFNEALALRLNDFLEYVNVPENSVNLNERLLYDSHF